jgi:hypothetical protein
VQIYVCIGHLVFTPISQMADLDAQDPNSMCNNLLAELKKMGFTAEFPPAKLRVGHGEAVCRVVEFVVDKALAKSRFHVSTPSKYTPFSSLPPPFFNCFFATAFVVIIYFNLVIVVAISGVFSIYLIVYRLFFNSTLRAGFFPLLFFRGRSQQFNTPVHHAGKSSADEAASHDGGVDEEVDEEVQAEEEDDDFTHGIILPPRPTPHDFRISNRMKYYPI